jgi:hypothetical protein
MYEFTLSRDRRRIVGRGRFGLYDYELATGRPRELLLQNPFDASELVTFGYNKDVNAVVAIRCNPSEPDSSGVWSYPLAPGQPTKVFSDPYCGPSSLNFWQLHRREVAPTEPNVPTGDRPTEIRAPASVVTIAGASPASSCAGQAATRSSRELPHGVLLAAQGRRAGTAPRTSRHGGPRRALAGRPGNPAACALPERRRLGDSVTATARGPGRCWWWMRRRPVRTS